MILTSALCIYNATSLTPKLKETLDHFYNGTFLFMTGQYY
jgi:hypothetical protein